MEDNQEKIFIENKCGEKLAGILHKNENSNELIIICHGSRSTKDNPIQLRLGKDLQKIYNVFRFDFSGNGESEGKYEDSTYSKDIQDMISVIGYLKEQKYKIKSVIGHSKSGTEVLLASRKLKEVDVKQIIALAPRIVLQNAYEWKKYIENKDECDKKGYFMIHNNEKEYRVTKDYISDLNKYGNVISSYKNSIKTLIIHGTNDVVIDISESEEFVKGFNEVSLIKIEGADHGFKDFLKDLSNEVVKALS